METVMVSIKAFLSTTTAGIFFNETLSSYPEVRVDWEQARTTVDNWLGISSRVTHCLLDGNVFRV